LQGCLREENITLSGNGNWKLRTLLEHLNSLAGVLVGSVLLIFLFVCVILLFVFTFYVLCCDVCYDFRIKTMFSSSLLPVVCRRAHVLFTLFVCWRIVVSNTYCEVFVLFVSSSCVPYVTGFSGLSIFDCPFGTL
jgi:uncharacterized membrane protein YesL